MLEKIQLPDGDFFQFWDDGTKYKKVFHVACENTRATDSGPGTEKRPFATISRAAAVLQPGQKVVIHKGIYRELVQPARGGESPGRMIAYQGAPRERVVIRGSRILQGPFAPTSGWKVGTPKNGATIWMADLPVEWFAGGYNPFLARNICDHFFTFTKTWTQAEVERFTMRRGMIFVSGKPLKQVFWPHELGANDGAFWVEEPGLRIHFRLPRDADPAKAMIEATVQEQVFAPRQRHLGYIRVGGLTIEQCADGVPIPQRAALSTTRGHHWIIENCTVRHAHAVGIDVGTQDWRAADRDKCGSHIIRRNVVSDCGVCGISGPGGVDHTLVEDNLVERIGGLNVERIWEAAALKFHTCHGVLIRRNVFRHNASTGGIWLDYLISNCRVTGNVFADLASATCGVFVEVSHARNMVDGNIFWNIRGRPNWLTPPTMTNPAAINFCTGEYGIAANNFIGNVADGPAIMLSLNQPNRLVDGRVGLCRRHGVFNNIVVNAKSRVHMARVDENCADGNAYDAAGDEASFVIEHPQPTVKLNLRAWQEFYKFDRHGGQLKMHADFDPDKLTLRFNVEGELPQPVAVRELGMEGQYPLLGPFTAQQWKDLSAGKAIKLAVGP